jgi:hypothetical protein
VADIRNGVKEGRRLHCVSKARRWSLRLSIAQPTDSTASVRVVMDFWKGTLYPDKNLVLTRSPRRTVCEPVSHPRYAGPYLLGKSVLVLIAPRGIVLATLDGIEDSQGVSPERRPRYEAFKVGSRVAGSRLSAV